MKTVYPIIRHRINLISQFLESPFKSKEKRQTAVEKLNGVPRLILFKDYIKLSPDLGDGAEEGEDISDAAIDRFLASYFGGAFFRLTLILLSPNVALIYALVSDVSVVSIQPYLSCFLVCWPWTSVVVLYFWLW